MLKGTGRFPDDGFLGRFEGYVRTRRAQVQVSGGVSIVGYGRRLLALIPLIEEVAPLVHPATTAEPTWVSSVSD